MLQRRAFSRVFGLAEAHGFLADAVLATLTRTRYLQAPTNVDESDDPLTIRVRGHDLAALAEYLVDHRKPLLAFIERRLGPALRRKVEVDDIFQETSVEAVRALSETEFGERAVFGWLCHIAERRIIDAHRRFFEAVKRDAG